MSGEERRPGPLKAGTPLALGLRLLDHQILGREQEMLGNVDDVALEERDGRLVAVGPAPGAGRVGAAPTRCARPVGPAVTRRLDPREDPRPLVLPLDHVLAVGSAVHVDPWAERLLAGTEGLELWLRRHLVARIPGARGGEHPFGGDLDARLGTTRTSTSSLGGRLLSFPARGRGGRRRRATPRAGSSRCVPRR